MPQEVQIICKRRGLKNLVKKIIWLQAYNAVSGIWRQEGRQWVVGNDGSKKSIKLAELAKVMEEYVKWKQKNKVTIDCADGGKVHIPADVWITKPARPFIMLWKIPEIWMDLRNRVRAFILTYLGNTKVRGGKTHSKHVVDSITEQVELLQKNQISQKKTDRNSVITAKIKGFDHPLLDTGRLFNSIRGRTKSTAIKGQAKEQKLKFLTQIDRILADFNRK